MLTIKTEAGIVRAVVFLEQRGEAHEATVELTGDEDVDVQRVGEMLRQVADVIDLKRFHDQIDKAMHGIVWRWGEAGNE